jgi:hypothetical protein
MNDDKIIDDEIASLVQAASAPIPEAIERRIAERSVLQAAGPRRRFRRILFRSDLWALVACGAALVAACLLLIPALRRPPSSYFSEIRTEFEIPDKNIKIIFLQRPDFKLPKED